MRQMGIRRYQIRKRSGNHSRGIWCQNDMIADYHLHLDYRAAAGQGGASLVLYPHFQHA